MHRIFETVHHEHLDSLVIWARANDYPDGLCPDSGLLLISNRAANWFLAVDYGCDYDDIPGICKPHIEPLEEPRFFSDRDKALEFAFEAIKQVHPELKGVNFSKYEEDEDNSIV
ncbi:hypothetical protein MKR81_26730 (plasmid) [Vibrio campbellii]|uniref:hypothetical protein n=1 Tax=Vibrio campbellii TaxID=680 RepID=UPI001F077701|nr:hypothetical protein [Vibrio campbellii]UMM06860.1 hypothetical protein MKR81_26730 [Vibrio campbellii]